MGLFSSSSYEKEDKRYNELIRALKKPIEERTLEEYDEDWHPKKICRIYNQAELNYLAERCGYQGDYIGVIYRNTICLYDKLEEMTKRMDNLVARLEQLEEKVNTPNLTR
ncbi:hypothetical protein [Anaerovibrio slackiae]|uniref:hypothetical protein n=1 Tax=Anaerovibrio slackiae TaxID=2652309 RepID=UPI003864FDBC